MVEQLSSDLISRVLVFVDLPDRLRLAMSSKALLRVVTEECSDLWVNIEFFRTGWSWLCSNDSEQSRRLLTDERLAALLRRVNARQRTKCLSLRWAMGLRGTGLAPMRGSRVLECIDLRVSCCATAERFDSQVAMEMLRSSIPYNLNRVKFPRRFDDMTMEEVYFIRDIRAAKLQQVRQQSTRCAACNNLTGYSSATEICLFLQAGNVRNSTGFGIPSTKCVKCLSHFCSDDECPISVLECSDCGDTACSTCRHVLTCTACGETRCKDCEDFTTSSICRGVVCSECDTSYCEKCQVRICGGCQDEHDIYFSQCIGCNDYCCGRSCCQKVQSCAFGEYDCENVLCESCGKLDCCEECKEQFCDECSELDTCEMCERMLCTECYGPLLNDDGSDAVCVLCAAGKSRHSKKAKITK